MLAAGGIAGEAVAGTAAAASVEALRTGERFRWRPEDALLWMAGRAAATQLSNLQWGTRAGESLRQTFRRESMLAGQTAAVDLCLRAALAEAGVRDVLPDFSASARGQKNLLEHADARLPRANPRYRQTAVAGLRYPEGRRCRRQAARQEGHDRYRHPALSRGRPRRCRRAVPAGVGARVRVDPVGDGTRRYAALYPGGWEASQAEAVRSACTDEGKRAFVAEREGAVVGFVVTQRHQTLGEVYMVAVDPALQGGGAGAALTAHGFEVLRAEGVSGETGGDPGHAPARRMYERAGFRVLRVARYFKAV